MKLILTRHGETEDNKSKIFQGHLGGELSKEGIAQAEKLAKRLSKEKIDTIYSSDLKRAADTAKIIGKYHPKIEIIFTKELREWDAGPLTGKSANLIDWNNLPEGMESYEQIFARAKKLLDKVYENHKNETVLFVGHGGMNRAIICNIIEKDSSFMGQIQNLKNTSVSIFELREDKKHHLHLLNCTKHLD